MDKILVLPTTSKVLFEKFDEIEFSKEFLFERFDGCIKKASVDIIKDTANISIEKLHREFSKRELFAYVKDNVVLAGKGHFNNDLWANEKEIWNPLREKGMSLVYGFIKKYL